MASEPSWTQPPLPTMAGPSTVIIRMDVVITADDGVTSWAITARDAINGHALAGRMTPLVQLDYLQDTQKIYLELLEQWLKHYGAIR